MVPANFNSPRGLASEETCWALHVPTGFDRGNGLASCLPLEHPAAVSLATNCPAVGSETARVGARHRLRMMWGCTLRLVITIHHQYHQLLWAPRLSCSQTPLASSRGVNRTFFRGGCKCQAPPRPNTACGQSSCFRSIVRGFSMGDGPSEVVCCLMAWFVLLWTGS